MSYRNKVTNEVVVALGEFDMSKLIIEKPEESTFNDITSVTSKIYYRSDDGKPAILYVEGAPQYSFGVNRQYPFACQETDKTEDKIIGYQMCYYLTSIENVNSPSEAEQHTIDWVNGLHAKVVETASDQEVLSELPQGVQKLLNPPETGVKPIFEHPSIIDPTDVRKKRRIPDLAKPQRGYFRLAYSKKSKKIGTRFYDPDGAEVNPLAYLDMRGHMHPLFRIDNVYFGTHKDRPFGASIKLTLAQVDFTPEVTTQIPSHRLLGPKKVEPIVKPVQEEEPPAPQEENESTPSARLIEAKKNAMKKNPANGKVLKKKVANSVS